jgi:hypothetical protein
MDGLWKPALVGFGLGAGLDALVWVGTRNDAEPVDAVGYAAMPLAALALMAIVAVRGIAAVGAYVRGLRGGGIGLEVQRDSVNWIGDRAVEGKSAAGSWRIASWGAKMIRVEVQGPGFEETVGPGGYRAAGKAAAERLRGGRGAST